MYHHFLPSKVKENKLDLDNNQIGLKSNDSVMVIGNSDTTVEVSVGSALHNDAC